MLTVRMNCSAKIASFQMAYQYTGTNNVRLAILGCDIEQQLGHLADFQQFRRTVAAIGRSPAKTIYELPANGRRMTSLTFSEAMMMALPTLRFESGEEDDDDEGEDADQ